MATKQRTILDLMVALGGWFKDDSWHAWRVVLRAIFGLPITGAADRVTFQQLTGRTIPPSEPVKEAWLVCGRRAGKSIVAALCAVFLACFKNYSDILAPGERGTVMIVAADRRQARVVYRYIVAFLELVPRLAAMIERKTAEGLDLTNGISIEIHTASFKAVAGS